MNINIIITEIEKFSAEVLSLDTPVDEGLVKSFENKYELKLPSDYKSLLEKYNGIGLYGVNVYGIKEFKTSYSLEECYLFEHFEVYNKMPLYLVPFSPDGGGNHYCFDVRFINENSCPIVFWQHDLSYDNEDVPEVVNDSFSEWMKEVMIDWTLEDYNYDGTSKL